MLGGSTKLDLCPAGGLPAGAFRIVSITWAERVELISDNADGQKAIGERGREIFADKHRAH